jgi:hypothetical protein
MRAQALLLRLAVRIASGPGLAMAARAASPEDSVVRVFTTMRAPNPLRPWAKQDAIEVVGTGVAEQ